MFDKTFDEIEVGERHVSRGRTITEADLIIFSMITQDWSDIHIDKEYVAKTVFKQRIAHAGLTMGVVSGLLQVPQGSPVEGFFGMHTVRFAAPVLLGDTIRGEVEVTGKEPRDQKSGVLDLNYEVKNQDGKALVLARLRAMVRRKTVEPTT